MSLPRKRHCCGNAFYVILGCAVTVFFFVVVNNQNFRTSIGKVTYGDLSKRCHKYEEVCRDCGLVLDQAKADDTNLDSEDRDESLDLSSHFHCDIRYSAKTVSQRGQYYVIYNFVRADKEFGCTESITLSTPGDYRFFDNIITLVDQWRGPISIALYAPGHDFYTTVKSIAYLRNCENYLIKSLVTFHIIFEQEHVPHQNGSDIINSYNDTNFNCNSRPPWKTTKDKYMYKTKNALLYPINLVRNVAKLAATTYFVFPSDIELYPTRNFIPLFLQFVRKNLELFRPNKKNVFALPIFEILADQQVPENKTRLQAMLEEKTAFIFHLKFCIQCHEVVDSDNWIKAKETAGLGTFSVGKRAGKYMEWEPFFVCTQNEPLWDERMTWEGQKDKIVQVYTMCLLDYNFYVLDNAFLVHKPGVKEAKVQVTEFNDLVKNTVKFIKTVAIELQDIYGYNSNCSTAYKAHKNSTVSAKKAGKNKAGIKKAEKDKAGRMT